MIIVYDFTAFTTSSVLCMYAGREELEDFEDGRSDTEVTAHHSECEATQTDSDSDHDSDDIPETYNKVKKTGKTLPQLFVNSE